MWLPNDVIEAVDAVARVYYVSELNCKAWNTHRKSNELRLLTGWMWSSKTNQMHQQGLKTKTQCYRDAYYKLVLKSTAPSLHQRMTLRRVS